MPRAEFLLCVSENKGLNTVLNEKKRKYKQVTFEIDQMQMLAKVFEMFIHTLANGNVLSLNVHYWREYVAVLLSFIPNISDNVLWQTNIWRHTGISTHTFASMHPRRYVLYECPTKGAPFWIFTPTFKLCPTSWCLNLLSLLDAAIDHAITRNIKWHIMMVLSIIFRLEVFTKNVRL